MPEYRPVAKREDGYSRRKCPRHAQAAQQASLSAHTWPKLLRLADDVNECRMTGAQDKRAKTAPTRFICTDFLVARRRHLVYFF